MELLDLAAFLLGLINAVIVPLVFSIAFVLFIVGAVKFFFSQESGEREKGRNFVLSAVIGFFVMVSIWGLVNVVVNTFGFNQANRPSLPHFGGSFLDRLLEDNGLPSLQEIGEISEDLGDIFN